MVFLIILLAGLIFGGLSGAVLKSRSKQEVEEFNSAVSNFKSALRESFNDTIQRPRNWIVDKLNRLRRETPE